MAEITVTPEGEDVYLVTVSEGSGSTTHHVTATPEIVAGYAPEADPAALVEASFRFLLEREPKEAIMGAFALPVIERYFGDYGRVIASYLR